MSESSRDSAVVARRVAYGEADLIVTLLCRERGKLSALARSARRSRRRFGSALELFTVSSVELKRSRGRDLHTLVSADVLASYADLALDVATMAHASYGIELVRDLWAAEVAEPEVFDRLIELFACLRDRGARSDVLRVFELSVLRSFGFAPVLDACAVCGRQSGMALDRGALLDPSRGGVVCSDCAPTSRGHGVRPLSPGGRAYLVRAQAGGALAEVDLGTGEGASEARDAMLALIGHQLGHSLKSVEFIGKLGRAGS